MTRAELRDAFVEIYGRIDSGFRHEIEELKRYGSTCLDMQSVVVEYGLRTLPTPWSPRAHVYFLAEGQVRKWVEHVNNLPESERDSHVGPERIRLILEACESGLSSYNAVDQTGACRNTVQKYYGEWKAVPTEVFEGVLDGKGATVAEAKAVAARRLDLPLSDGLVRNKLDLMVLMERCEKVEDDGETRYRTKM